MALVISAAMAPSSTPSLHGSSRLSRESSGTSMPPSPPPPALAQKDAPLFTDEEFQALMSGECDFLSFFENDLQSPSPSPSPLVSLQMQAQLLCREDDAYGRFQEMPPSFALDDLEAPISDEEILALICDEEGQALFCDEEIQALCAAPAQQQESMQLSSPPLSDDQQAGKKRMSSPPWPSCIADEDDEGEEAGPPPLPPLPPPPPSKKARTTTKSRSRREHEPPSSPCPIKKARTHTKRRSRSRGHAASAARADRRLRRLLRKWHNTIATRILARQFRPPEVSRGRTALRCRCPELGRCCALHQDALPEHRAWMFSAQGHGAPPLVGWPGEVLVPAVSAGSSKAMVRQYGWWRRSVSLPSRFYVQRAVEKGRSSAAA